MSKLLDDLNDADFADRMKNAMWRDFLWAPFEDEDVVDRTLEALTSLRASLEGQLAQYSSQENVDWSKRAKRYLIQVAARHAQVKRRIRHLNRRETAETAAFEKKWGTFAYNLACALEGSDHEDMLNEIMLSDEISAREWLAARRAQRLAKGRAI